MLMIMRKGWKEYFLEYFNAKLLKEEFASELIKNDQSISANVKKFWNCLSIQMDRDNNLSINEKG